MISEMPFLPERIIPVVGGGRGGGETRRRLRWTKTDGPIARLVGVLPLLFLRQLFLSLPLSPFLSLHPSPSSLSLSPLSSVLGAVGVRCKKLPARKEVRSV